MSSLMMSDLLADLSAEQQQLLAGGQNNRDDEDDFFGGQGSTRDRDEDLSTRTRVYRIRKTSRSLIRVERVS